MSSISCRSRLFPSVSPVLPTAMEEQPSTRTTAKGKDLLIDPAPKRRKVSHREFISVDHDIIYSKTSEANSAAQDMDCECEQQVLLSVDAHRGVPVLSFCSCVHSAAQLTATQTSGDADYAAPVEAEGEALLDDELMYPDAPDHELEDFFPEQDLELCAPDSWLDVPPVVRAAQT